MKKPVPPTVTVLGSGWPRRGWGKMRLKKSSPKGHSSPKFDPLACSRRSASMRTTDGPILSAMVTKSRVAFSWAAGAAKRFGPAARGAAVAKMSGAGATGFSGR